VPEKLWRSASKAANSIVESSDTKNVALQAIQNAGHGDLAGIDLDWLFVVEETLLIVISTCRQINGLLRGQASLDLLGHFIGQDLMGTRFKRLQCALDDGLWC